jgi:signal transduction histidine kinase
MPVRGLGLGLSIVQRLARLLGIGVRLSSRPGGGTEITLSVTRVAGAQRATRCAG